MENIPLEVMENWLYSMQTTRKDYKHPILDTFKLNKIKLLCDSMEQDTHVFLMTVEVLESYLKAKNAKRDDPLLLVLTTISICRKYVGDMSELKTSLVTLYHNVTRESITNTAVNLMEMKILATIDFKLPLHTAIDDLKTLLEFYVSSLKLKVDLTTLTEQMLIFHTMYNSQIFTILKLHYLQNTDMYSRFIETYTNQLYVPIGCILCAIKISKLANILDIEHISADLSDISGINPDDLHFLSDEIIKYWHIQKRNTSLFQ